MTRILPLASLRHLARHPWITVLSVVGVALGVAVVVAVDVSSRSARVSFELATEAIGGRATHQIVGGPAGVPEAIYTELRTELGLRSSAPVVEGRVAVGETGRTMTLLGVDPLAEAPFRGWADPTSAASRLAPGGLLGRFLTDPRAALLAGSTAAELGLAPGDAFPLVAAGRRHRMVLVEVLRPADPLEARGIENLLLVDIATAQELLGHEGRLSRIDLRLEEDSADAVGRLAAELPEGVKIEPARGRGGTADELTRAFRLNLLTLSLLALLCGGFLIYNSVTFSVVVRRPVFGTLRALGTSRGRILRLVLVETVTIGLVGSLLGALLGQLLARGLVGMVTQTISDFYFTVALSDLPVDPTGLGRGVALGVLVAAAAGARPAWEASRAAPRQALLRSELERGARRGARRAAWSGAAAIAAGALVLAFGSRSLPVSFAGVFAILLGCALATPAAVRLASLLFAPLLAKPFGLFGRLAARGLAGNLSRTGVAVAALMLALAVTIGIGLMIGSFRGTVERWLVSSLPADLYLTDPTASSAATPTSPIEAAWLEEIAEIPGVTRVNTLRRATVGSSAGEVVLVALDMDERSYGAFALKRGDAEAAWRGFRNGSAVLVSEPLAFRTGVEVGDELALDTPVGPVAHRVGGIFYDYSTDRGYVLIDLGRYRRLWRDDGITAASAFVAPGTDLDRVAERIRTLLPAGAAIEVRSQAELRRQSLVVFDRTFRITAVLRTLTTVVALIGILGALMAHQLERTAELGLLRAAGMTRRQLWLLVTTQTGLLGLVAGLLALPVGLVMAALTTLVINQRSFGWTIPLEIDPAVLAQSLLLAVATAILAGLLPSARMAATSPAEALRTE